ncbi:hypothetical protein DFH09DRAFT_1178315, partial [Mycena vulgaris]
FRVFPSDSVSSHSGTQRYPPSLPPEITLRILRQLREDQPAVLTCALVCRGWLASSPLNTLASNVRRIHIAIAEGSRTPRRLLPLLPHFPALRSLKFWSMGTEDIPHLPGLRSLDLAGVVFPSYAHYRTFMTGLSALRHLKLCNVSWEIGHPGDEDDFPSFNLESFDLDWGPRPATEEILFAIRTQRLALASPEAMVDEAFSALVSRYLHFLGADLKHLELNCNEDIALLADVDFSACTDLAVL